MRSRPVTITGLVLFAIVALTACSAQPAASVTPVSPSNEIERGATAVPTAMASIDHTPEVTVDGTIGINATGEAIPIDPRLFGTNVPAWLNSEGLANQILRERAKAAALTVFRLPGGSWSNTYKWLDCQVERTEPCTYAARPSDFLELLAATGAEGMWTVSFNGTAEEAAALVAFFNGEVSDERPIGVDPRGQDWKTVGHWAQVRSDAGYSEPLGLKLWEVGNEVYGGKAGTGKDCADWGWEDGWTCDGTEYVKGKGKGRERRQGFLEFRAAMRAVDPSILVGAVGVPYQNEWNNWGNEVIAAAGEAMDFYVIHQYAFFEAPNSYEVALAQPQGVWGSIAKDIRTAFTKHAGGREVPIAVTEYNLFSFQDSDQGFYMSSAVNMLFLADTIGQMASNGFMMANQWNLANGVTDKFGNYGLLDAGSLQRYPQYYVFPLWSRFGNALLPSTSSFDAALDMSVYAGRTAEGQLSLMVINKGRTTRSAIIAVDGVSSVTQGTVDVVQADVITSRTVSFNGIADPADDLSNARPVVLNGVSPRFKYTFEPTSITLLRLEVMP